MVSKNTNYSILIECEDIILREYRLSDLERMQEITWQPEIHGFLPGWNVQQEVRQDWLMNYEIPTNNEFIQRVQEGNDIEDLILRLGIVLKGTGEFIGWCCSGIKDELPEPNREVMYAISKDHRNKGYASQAVQGVIQYLFENTEVAQLNAIALLENKPSNKVIQKNHFVFINEIQIEKDKYNHYLLHKSDWISLNN
ncbi:MULTISPECIES: GNAT family N-acetyltransferase [Paenibacillus]|uniref:GNAT family N-acetyltransferase n=1 Tax=Paenibacillus xylanilyticus TaxID=248903 RepID=A0A7Y6EZ03_9BACL|nr:GNAT family N-acetyltransferase [Paenibacillus xylanilyticus]NUU79388.1 GNAT family N-acetyltransferase [Paenibacillus xylanilyticus]